MDPRPPSKAEPATPSSGTQRQRHHSGAAPQSYHRHRNDCKVISSFTCNQQQLHQFPWLQTPGSSFSSSSSLSTCPNLVLVHNLNSYPVGRCNSRSNQKFSNPSGGSSGGVSAKLKGGKENVWSVDNEMARAEKDREKIRWKRKKKGLGRLMNALLFFASPHHHPPPPPPFSPKQREVHLRMMHRCGE